MRKQILKSLRIAAAVATLSALAVTVSPNASADPLDPIRGAVNGTRGQSACGPLNYSVPLEGEAQALAGNTLPGVPAQGQYGHPFRLAGKGIDDPEDAAISAAVGQAAGAIKDCKYKDFGVGFVRNEDKEEDTVTIVLGEGAPAAPKKVACPAGSATPEVDEGQQCQPGQPVQCPAGSKTPTVPAGQQCEAAPPKQCPPGSASATVPPDQQCAAPTNTVQMNIAKRGLTNATVTITNSGPLGGQCTYNAKPAGGAGLLPPVSRNVNLDPNGTATITDLLWPPIGATYHVVLSCTGNYDGKPLEFGHAEQDVSGI